MDTSLSLCLYGCGALREAENSLVVRALRDDRRGEDELAAAEPAELGKVLVAERPVDLREMAALRRRAEQGEHAPHADHDRDGRGCGRELHAAERRVGAPGQADRPARTLHR